MLAPMPDLPAPAMASGDAPEAVFSPPPVLSLTTDSQLRILSACTAMASFTGYDKKDLQGFHLGYLVEEKDRLQMLRAGILAIVGLNQQLSLAMATCAGVHCTLVGEVCATVMDGQHCLLWTFRKQCPPSASPKTPLLN